MAAARILTVLNNDLSNNNQAWRLFSYSDGADADTVPVVASGNKFTGSSYWHVNA